MEELRKAADVLTEGIKSLVSKFIKQKQALSDEAEKLAKLNASIKAREFEVSLVERGQAAKRALKERESEVKASQKELAQDREELERQARVLNADKTKWEKQKSADQDGISKEREDIRSQNAALTKDRKEYKIQVMKKLGLKGAVA